MILGAGKVDQVKVPDAHGERTRLQILSSERYTQISKVIDRFFFF